ncbi:unnamed protein product [Hermetia illucens]|uniref:Uncharacterized protein n=1 Tax=Hermetia illucens TaxID=343691 RepID=A0A7R8URX2_HERIL|nr:acid-sensing ion channel 4-A [Hermetia illucens]CAD7085902.1 unnamed protein product [Hermetia illucens]
MAAGTGKSYCKDKLEKCRSWIQKDPTKLIRYIVLLICCIVVTVQLSECFSKLRFPPITTHSHYELNDTMQLPAVTICREPGYKPDVLKKYGLATHPKFYQSWKRFPFNTTDISDVFSESTYSAEEILVQRGLDGEPEGINITSNLHFTYGMCHTFRGVRPTKSSFKDHGYSIMVKHDLTKEEGDILDVDVGWHIFIHELAEEFTEIRTKASGRVEYMFVGVEEDVEIKLQTQFFNMMTDGEKQCLNIPGYSAPKCGELCLWRELTNHYQCTGPWMPDIDMPTCSTYETMSKLITDYSNMFDNQAEPLCSCPDPCQSTIYSAFVMNRKDLVGQLKPYTQIWLYYTSRLVTIIEERPGYDLSQFVADIGGSIGFLLGLSVLGFIEILEKIAAILLLSIVKKRKGESIKGGDTRRSSYADGSSDITMEISTISNGGSNPKGK